MSESWERAERSEQVVPAGAELVIGPVDRLSAMLGSWADRFGEERLGSPGLELRLGGRGLVADEAASLLRALDAGLVEVDGTGGVRVRACRAKATGGRYSLFSANRYGGTPYVSLNTEYLIQIGAACELVAFHGWATNDVEIEVGEFDAIAHAAGRTVLAVEAKARIDGPDSLRGLWAALVQYAAEDEPPEPRTNHSRKYVELLRLAEAGPMALWLVAAQARWLVRVERREHRLALAPCLRVSARSGTGACHDRVRCPIRCIGFRRGRRSDPRTRRTVEPDAREPVVVTRPVVLHRKLRMEPRP